MWLRLLYNLFRLHNITHYFFLRPVIGKDVLSEVLEDLGENGNASSGSEKAGLSPSGSACQLDGNDTGGGSSGSETASGSERGGE